MNSNDTQLSKNKLLEDMLISVDVKNCREEKIEKKKKERKGGESEGIDWLTIISSKNDENKQLRRENNDRNGYRSKETQTKQLSRKQITDFG